jgi:hypothetical protein
MTETQLKAVINSPECTPRQKRDARLALQSVTTPRQGNIQHALEMLRRQRRSETVDWNTR